MIDQFSRTALFFGEKGMQKLASARVAVFGIGGVGGHTAEALVRSGIGALDIIDNDTVSITNVNRQLFATLETVGRYKTEVACERLAQLNPACRITPHTLFYLPETADEIDLSRYDYIVDAIDTISGKIMLAERAAACGVPLISSMGAGNKLDPTAFRVADIYQTSVCPLAKVMRHELKKRGIRKLKVVYSEELPISPDPETLSRLMAEENPDGEVKKRIPASNAFVPSVVGLIIAGEVIKDLTGIRERKG
ncbi:MAG: tRNA threonylcarbamoyladenosine dehydratase [Oscillospiraceae bacterium]|nr:tRNA threonylcarbamoyladenosine dehydratase [Oscillospiraceae bacterium]